MNDSTHVAGEQYQTPRGDRIVVGALLLSAAILVLFRLHAFGLPLETDECNYAYIGERLLQGDRLYVDVWDHQPPGVYVLFAGASALFGDAPVVFRLMAMVFSLTSLVLLVRIAGRTAGAPAAAVAALLFALASSDPGTAGEGCNREIYMNTLLLGAWCLAGTGAVRTPRRLVAAGALLALASALKTVVAVHWVFLAGWILAAESRHRGRTGWAARAVLYFAIGPAVLWLGMGAYFALTSRLTEFVDATFLFNVSYAEGQAGFLQRFAQFFHPPRHPFTFDSALPLWIAGAVAFAGLLVLPVVRRQSQRVIPLLLLALSSFIAVCLPAHFWPHYYHLMIPPLVLLVACAAAELASLPFRAARAISLGTAATLVLLLAGSEWMHYLRQPLFGITVTRYNSRDFWGRAIGAKVGSVTDPGDYVFVYGNDAEIYYYAQRRCASRFTMISGIAAGRSGAESRRRLMMDDLRAHPPRLIILLLEEPPFPEWRAFLDAHYGQPVGWDLHDKRQDVIMYVLADRQRPIAPIDWNWDRSEVGGWFLGDQPTGAPVLPAE